ncbi:biosynthetic peptidoglycan transglycosylase [Pedobacter sp. R-06]|uniref:biosynthetic peptidoglycan transglycosylase n=1 Tax=Pedobacter sp. R-06 TaxID=3404051 RepID=UPI003CEF6DF9
MVISVKNFFLIIIWSVLKEKAKALFFLRLELNKIAKKYDVTLLIKDFSFHNFNTIEVVGIQIRLKKYNVDIKSLEISFSLKVLLFGSGFFRSITVVGNEIRVTASQKSDKQGGNFKESKIDEELEVKYYSLFNKAMRLFFNISINLDLRKINFSAIFPVGLELDFKCDNNNAILLGFTLSKPDKTMLTCLLEGTIDRKNKSVSMASKSNLTQSQYFYADIISFSYLEKEYSEMTVIEVEINACNLLINQKFLSESETALNDVSLILQLEFSSEKFILTKNSKMLINNILLGFEFFHEVSDKDLIKLTLCMETDVEKFLKSFPKFHNENLRTIICSGTVFIECRLMFLINDPYNYFFDIKLAKDKFVILNFGKFDLSLLDQTNNNSLHHIISSDVSYRYTYDNVCIHDICPKLLDILIFVEDPNFYIHKGIDPYFIGVAIVSNIDKRRFSRGGSTITMQLSRNLFLNHHKNLLRKVEEIFIALLIENYFAISKSRILEIYINIIEFAPNVYGINSASNFYFSKKPKDLTILECIVLTYIIPRPKHFYDALKIKTEQLTTNLFKYILSLSVRLFNKGLITKYQKEQIFKTIDHKNLLDQLFTKIRQQ